MLADREAFDVFENKALSIELMHEAHEIKNELVTWIVERPVTNQRKALAWRTTEHAIDRLSFKACTLPDLIASKLGNRGRDYGRFREIEFVDGTMHGVDLDRGFDVEACLLEAEA